MASIISPDSDPEAFQEALKSRLQQNIIRFEAWLKEQGISIKKFADLTGLQYLRVLRATKGETMPIEVLTAVLLLDPQLSERWLLGIDDADDAMLGYQPHPANHYLSQGEAIARLNQAEQLIFKLQERLLSFKVASLQLNDEDQQALALGRALLHTEAGQSFIQKHPIDNHPDQPRYKQQDRK